MAIQRFDIGGSDWGLIERTDGTGRYCYYSTLAWYRRQCIQLRVLSVIVTIICAILASLLVTSKYAPEPVPVLVPMGAGEKAELLKELTTVRKERDAWKERSANYKAQIKILTAAVEQDGVKLAALQERGKELDRLNRNAALKMGTAQETIIAAKKVLGPMGISHVEIINR